MLRVTSDVVDSNGLKIHYYRTGGAKPALVLAHGITDDGLCWIPVAEVLASGYDIIMVDARGHGKSEAPAEGYTLRTLGMELAGVIHALKLEKPILLGHSMGAITTLILAALFPDLPRAILLEDPPPFWMSSEINTQNKGAGNGLTDWIHSNKRKTRGDLLTEFRTSNATWPDVELDPWINSKHRYSSQIATLVHPEDMVSINFPNLFRQVTCPALFISADVAKGAASGERDIAYMKEQLLQLQVVPVPDAGHNIRREQFGLYMNIVQEFLADLP